MAFTLKVTQIERCVIGYPVYWWAEYAHVIGGPIFSPWMLYDEVWECPYGCEGYEDLCIYISADRVHIAGSYENVNVGAPLRDGHDYEFVVLSSTRGRLDDITEGPPLLIDGAIVDKRFQYDNLLDFMPATAVPFDSRGIALITCTNDSTDLGILLLGLIMRDPNGQIVKNLSLQSGWVAPGNSYTFNSAPAVSLNIKGNWSLELRLSVGLYGQTPVLVDTWSGTMCTVQPAPAPPEEFRGSITKIELNHDGVQAPLPVAGVAQGEKGILHVWGRNNMTTTQRMGISWEVRDPNGIVVQIYQDWEEWPYTDPGGEHHFIGPRLDSIDFNKVGTYTINAGLYMNPDNPVLVNTYAGKLCIVEAVAPPEEFAGTITKLELEYDEARASIPAYDIPQGERGLVHVYGRNDMTTTQQLGISWEVKDPDGVVVETHSEWEMWPYAGLGVEHHFIGGRFDLDKQGSYTLKVDLLMNQDSPVIVDTYSGNLCTVVVEEVPPEVPPDYELVYHYEYPRGKTYVGKAEECSAKFTVSLPEQLFPNSWVTERIADAFADEVAKEGGEMLDIKIFEDATPMWHTDYKIVATAVTSPFPWAVVIGLILAIILVVAFTNLVVEFKDIDWGEIPTPIPWAIFAVVGGVAVVGAAVAFALTRKKS